MTRPAVERMSPPARNTGAITIMPTSMLKVSVNHPMIGSTTRPGITNRAPIEYPSERARGGMASDRAANTPGPMMASAADRPMFTTTATERYGASANSAASPAVKNAT
jgi:hypothetical protein